MKNTSAVPRSQRPASKEAERLVRAQTRVVESRVRAWQQRPEDPDALHDVRTSLRRLRVVVRSFRPELGRLARRGIRRRLRAAARVTSATRDIDVFAAWVSTLPPSPATRRLLDVAAAEIAAVRPEALRAFMHEWTEARRRLRAGRIDGASGARRLFGTAAARAIRAELQEVTNGLATFDPSGAPDAVHATRIAAKRIRYLFDALAAPSPDARRIVAWCRLFQDLVGEWRDAQLASARVRACPSSRGRDAIIRLCASRRRRARTEMQRFVADTDAWRIARRDGLALARRYALAASDRARRSR